MCGCSALICAIDRFIEKADDDLESILGDAGYTDAADTVDEITRLEQRVVDELKKQTTFFTQSLNQSIDLETYANEIWPGVKLTDDLAAKLTQVFVEEFSDFMPELISHCTAKIDPELVISQLTQRTTSWISNWGRELAEIMELNSHKEIETLLNTGLESGQGIPKFTRAILDSGIRDEHYKARRVAVTEVLGAHSVATEEAIIQCPAAESKEWVHSGAYRIEPRWNHVDMNGIIVPKDESFVLVGADGSTYLPRYPRDTDLPPGERINCHCIHRPIVSEEVLGLPFEERRRLQAEAIAADDEAWIKELDAKNRARAGIAE